MELFEVYQQFDLEIVSGEGCYVYDQQGKAYLDVYGGHAVISVGHSHPHYIQRISEQLKQLAFYSNAVPNALQQQLAQLLGQVSECEDYRLFLCNSGAEANENALKLASFHNGKQKIIAFRGGFHGRTSAAVNITDHPSIKALINQNFPVVFLELNQLEAAEQALAQGDVCAVIIEGIQGIGGIHIPEPAFLQSLAALCQKHDALLIADEIQSGYGRSGKFFAFQHAGIEPDLITMAKGMGNGFPMGGVLIHPKFKARYGLLGSTFGGNPLACAAGLAVLEIIQQEQLVSHAQQLGEVLLQQLSQYDSFESVRGKGLMIGMEMAIPVAPLRHQLLFDQQVFTGSSSNPKVMRLLPPLTIQKQETDLFLQKLTTAMAMLNPIAMESSL